MVANVASHDGGVPEASDEEMRVFLASHRHIAPHSFDPDRWRESVGEEHWRKVVYVLSRGGRFQTYDATYRGERMANAYSRQVNLYHEKTNASFNSMTGERLIGYARHIPISDSLGRPLEDEARGYGLHLSTFRASTQTKSRTNTSTWLLAIKPDNEVLINRITAEELALKDGEIVKLSSLTNPSGEWDLGEIGRKPVAGRLKVIEGVRPGLVTFCLGFGQWGNGVLDMEIDGQIVRGDERRGRGIHANAVMGVDPHLGNTCLTDPVGASAVFYDTKVRLEKISEAPYV
jgi:tetrathionate reductase subunit A